MHRFCTRTLVRIGQAAPNKPPIAECVPDECLSSTTVLTDGRRCGRTNGIFFRLNRTNVPFGRCERLQERVSRRHKCDSGVSLWAGDV